MELAVQMRLEMSHSVVNNRAFDTSAFVSVKGAYNEEYSCA
jgi:hypothetical protein